MFVDRSDLAVGKFRQHKNRKVVWLVVHRNTARPDLDSLAEFFRTDEVWGLPTFPYHFWIDRDGHVSQIHDPNTISPHARGLNSKGIGVAIQADGRVEPPTEAQYKALADVYAWFLEQYPNGRLIRHSESKPCPGPYFRLNHPLLKSVERRMIDARPGPADG